MIGRPAIGRAMRFRGCALGRAILLACWPFVGPKAQSLDLSQYAHTTWRTRDGFAKGDITSIAQTYDGYLWVGTERGLFRFDGVRAVAWQPPAGEQLPANFIAQLLVGRDSTLWIATLKGLASWKGGKLTNYPEVAGQVVTSLLEDHEATVWFGLALPGRLCAIRGGKAQCYGARRFSEFVRPLYEDRKGNLWLASPGEVWRWAPGLPERYKLPGMLETNALIESDSGVLVLATSDGLKEFTRGKARAFTLPGVAGKFRPAVLVRTRDGSLWIGSSEGLFRMHQGRTDRFGAPDGLSGDDVTGIHEDLEGNVWISTVDGLDRFREVTIPTMSVNQGLTSSRATTVLATPDGSVWIGTPRGLNRWQNSQVTVYARPNTPTRGRRGTEGEFRTREAKDVSNSGLRGSVSSLGLDDRGRLWASTGDTVLHFVGGRFVPVPGAPSGYVSSIAGDGHGKVWTINNDAGLVSVAVDGAVQQIPWARFSGKQGARALLPDVSRGGVWLGFFDGGIAYVEGGQVRASYTAADGLGNGRVDDLRFGADGAVWAATESGLSRLKDGRLTTLTSRNGLPCDGVHWAIEDDEDALWLLLPCGLVRIARSEVDAWLNDPRRSIRTTLFDGFDGVRSRGAYGASGPHVTKSADGRIWFLPGDGVSVIDPRHLAFNSLPPPVHIEQITADGKTYDPTATANGHMRLPPNIHTLAIDYTALSLAVPEKVRFRFMLEGQDRDWREAVNQRRVEYSNLRPRNYRFRVMAANNSGVWNEQGASLEFAIPPTFVQSRWFVALWVVALGGAALLLYRLRMAQVARALGARYAAALDERTRIAQELHDSLLQDVNGMTLQLQVVQNLLADGPPAAAEMLSRVLTTADATLRDARTTIWDLRAPELETHDLPSALAVAARRLVGDDSVDVHLSVVGHRKKLDPMLETTALRITREAVTNALKHGAPSRIDIDVIYEPRVLQLAIRDDGRGIGNVDVNAVASDGHWGIKGMRERAARHGGTLEIRNGTERGCAVTVTLRTTNDHGAA